ncbi:hypothetical protein DNI29_21775 [Hymenobacter sediminis]|uniref:hypothetical protein n=1 Tax=Hymenobacter sediminis TaxID=2218621 RepID=UPI000DA6572D|nr:hypothetical protein [Hymenobacter sediminis]RPD44338.1 hypothetical protein DNI29_21775 [Hymenobacter sediminis]
MNFTDHTWYDPWATEQQSQQIDRLDSVLTELTRRNAWEYEALGRQTTQEIAPISEDTRFLNQVRELIRFVREA